MRLSIKRHPIGLALTFALMGIVALFLAGLGRAGKSLPPGVSAGISTLDQLPVVQTVAPDVQKNIALLATTNGADPAAAIGGLRLAASSLGSSQASVYVFKNPHGSPCVLLTGPTGVGFCATKPSDGTPGLHWAIGGGDSVNPSHLVSVASDDVSQINLTVDGAAVPVLLRGNIAYAEFPSAAQKASIAIVRANGDTNTFDISLAG
jgi:hypothetical protein